MAEKILKGKIIVKGTEITVLSVGSPDDFISLTDIARYKNPHEPKDVWLTGCACETPLNTSAFGNS